MALSSGQIRTLGTSSYFAASLKKPHSHSHSRALFLGQRVGLATSSSSSGFLKLKTNTARRGYKHVVRSGSGTALVAKTIRAFVARLFAEPLSTSVKILFQKARTRVNTDVLIIGIALSFALALIVPKSPQQKKDDSSEGDQ